MPPTPEGTAGRRLALVVATGAYADPTLAKLRAPGRDATDLAAVLGDAAVGGFEVESVLDAPTEEVRRQVARFCAQIGPSDLALVYLSCHGVLDDRGRLYYATTDTDRSLLSATAVSSAWLNEQLEDSRGRRQILVLDCCHSGAFAKGAKGESNLALARRFEGRGRVVLTGSRGTEYSFEHDHVVGDSVSSVFTGSLVEGLRSGEADRDGDGLVTVNELYEYVYDAVRAKEARQTPTLWTYGAEGDLLVARSPKGAAAEPPPLRPPPPPQPPADPRDAAGAAPPSPSPPWRTRRRVAAIAAAAFVLLLVVAALLTLGGEEQPVKPGPIPVEGSPRGIAANEEGDVWVARHRGEAVDKINPPSEAESIDLGSKPERVAVGEGWIWASIDEGRALAGVSPGSTEVTNVPLEHCACPPTKLMIAAGRLWVGSSKRHAIISFNPKTGAPIDEYAFGSGFGGVFTIGGGNLWLVGTDEEGDGSAWLRRLDPSTGEGPPRDSSFFERGANLDAIAYGAGTVWVADSEDGGNEVTAFDPDSESVVKRIGIENGVTGDDLAVVGDTVLVWDPDEGFLTQIDVDELKARKPERVNGYGTAAEINFTASDLAVADGLAWITDPAGERVFKEPVVDAE